MGGYIEFISKYKIKRQTRTKEMVQVKSCAVLVEDLSFQQPFGAAYSKEFSASGSLHSVLSPPYTELKIKYKSSKRNKRTPKT